VQGLRRAGATTHAAASAPCYCGGEKLHCPHKPQVFPQLHGIMALFSCLITAASLWVHLLAINLFAACSVYLQGRQLAAGQEGGVVQAKDFQVLCCVVLQWGKPSAGGD
jgi:hypothetical protein